MELDHGTVIVFHMKWLAFWLDRARVLASHGRVADTPQFRPASSTLAAGGVPEIPSDGWSTLGLQFHEFLWVRFHHMEVRIPYL